MFKALTFDQIDGPAATSLAEPVPNGPRGFTRDPRFGRSRDGPAVAIAPAAQTSADWQAGYAAALDDARSAAGDADQVEAATARIDLALGRFDQQQATVLSARLRDAVVALCATVIDLGAIDPAAIERRIDAAATLLQRAGDDREVWLHPDDLALVAPRLATDIRLLPDPLLERGTVRVDIPTGGIEDGPAGWRRAIEAAIDAC